MPKVLHIINGEFYAGAERVQDLLVMCLPEFGYETHLACLKTGLFKTNCACPKEFVHEFSMKSRVDMAQVRNIANFVKQNHISLLHTHTPRAALIGVLVALRCGLPRVHHVHSPTSRDTENQWRNVINTVIERISVVGVKHFIAVSESIGKWTANMGISSSRITIVPNGVPAQAQSEATHDHAGLTVGSVALFRPRKGLEVLIQALGIARANGADITLDVIGGFETAEYEHFIKELASKLQLQDHIVWRGFQKDIPSELARLDIFALPSLYGEGMPMVILEALAAGLPIVASDVEGIPQVLERNEEVGLLAVPGDAESLAAQLCRIASMNHSEREKMSHAARAKHSTMYSEFAMAKNVAKVYANVLAEK